MGSIREEMLGVADARFTGARAVGEGGGTVKLAGLAPLEAGSELSRDREGVVVPPVREFIETRSCGEGFAESDFGS